MTSLSPDVTPLPYVAGRTLNLKTLLGKDVELVITRICSIAMSPVMEVQLQTSTGPKRAILKLFDRRFGETRELNTHTPQAEAAWENCVRSGSARRIIERLQNDENERKIARLHGSAESESESNDDSEAHSEDEDESEDSVRDNLNKSKEHDEAIIYHSTMEYYASEVQAYKQLESLQGRCIPRFIDSVIHNPPNTPADLAAEYFHVPGILLEYIPGFPLTELTTKIPNHPSVWERVVQDAIAVVQQVNLAGVVHDDCEPRNMLVRELKPGLFQPYLIDFSQCFFKADWKDTDDAADTNGFAYVVAGIDNHGGIAVMMRQRIKRETSYELKSKMPWE